MASRFLELPLRIARFYTGSGEKNSIEYWQRFVFYVMSLTGLFFGSLCYFPSVAVLLSRGEVLGSAVLTLIYALDLTVVLLPRPRIKPKAVVIAFSFYLVGLCSLFVAGPEGESGIWFTVSVLLCSLFVSFKAAAFFALFDFLTGLAFGLLHARGLVGWAILKDFPFSSWLLQGSNIFFMDLMFAVANTMLIRGVGDSFRTITAAEAKVRSSLSEKETLIRELYHRSKNNMQVVSSLLSLHMKELESEAPKAVFKDVINQIVAMSLVHQKLYESQDLSKIDMADYVKDLVALMAGSFGVPPGKIAFDLDLEPVTLLIDTALPCGLVVSEIVANSIKYAFPGERRGRIRVSLEDSGLDGVELAISDDGVGLAEGFVPETQGKMGMRTLFRIVKHQLQGSIDLESPRGGASGNASGVAYLIRFGKKLYAERLASEGLRS